MTHAEGEHTETLIGDAEIIERVKAGDNAAYGTLYERHAGAARGLARQLLRGEAEVEDAVAEAFTKVLSVIQRGGGPSDAFRPYLLTAVRNAAYDRGRGDRRQVVTDDMETYDSGEPFVDPALEGLERSLIARAFLSLPERWQSVLWHTEIEGVKPAEAATILGMNANGVAALAYRAREGLRQAYLQMHLAGGGAAEACRPTLGLLGAYVRGGLSKRDTTKVDRHMDDCGDCREVYAELMDVNVGLRGIVLPLVVGFGATGYLTVTPGGAATGAWWNRMSRRQQQVSAGAAAAAGVAVAVALALVGGEGVPPSDPPPVAAPQEDAPAAGNPAAPADPPAQGPADPADPAPAAPAPDPEPAPSVPADVPAASVPEPAPEPEEPPAPDTPDAPPAPEEPDAPEAPQDPGPVFAAGIDPVGSLVPGSDGIMVLDVLNTGTATAGDVLAAITLPPGVEMVSSGGAGNAVPLAVGHGDWGCAAGSGGGECVRTGMAEGENSTQFLDVRVASDADVHVPASVVISSGEARFEAVGERGVTPDGIAARYATAGQVRTETVGNALLTCTEPEPPKGGWPWPWWGWPGGGQVAPPDGRTTARDGRVDPPPDADLRPAPADADEPAAPGSGGGGLGDLLGDAPGGSSPEPEEEESGAPEGDGGGEGAEGGHGGGPEPEVPSDPPGSPEPTDPGYTDEDEEHAEQAPGACADARQRIGDRLDNDNWVMAPLDRDLDPTTTSSSSAVWELPEGGAVRWAGLYFSAAGEPASPTARVKGPGMAAYTTVTATDTRVADLPGYRAYQAFADVTALVRSAGGGEWWVADVPASEGRGVHAGWSLVVVLEDPSVEGYHQAMVLDETTAVFQDDTGARFPVSGLLPESVPARFDVVAWEGDADLGGDRVMVGGTPLAPTGGHGSADNVFVGSARGAVGDPMAFGTDVARFDAVLGRETDIRIPSGQDAVVVGVVALTAPMRT
ncbi:sigma-70 family RNA polymerase sigma factor [Nocardiopsis sp. NPDC007018]|uniref:sigma-70 family RNA polymerase sigma factor n=1 Tax=Nocardiopsis sp. NPDC007018 TaxID=3155721 RepID=UPI0033F7B336